MFKKISPLVAALLAGGLVLAGAAPAGAEVVERHIIDEFDSGTSSNFCGSGLQPTYTFERTGSYTVKTRGPDGTLWFQEKVTTIQTFTYNGMTVTDIQPNTLGKDLKIVDNGDGTLDITVLYTGGGRLIGSDGKLLAKNDGQIRMLYVVSIATGQTLSEELIFGSTGTNSDYCEAILDHWGV